MATLRKRMIKDLRLRGYSQRIIQMCEALGLNYERTLKTILVYRAYNSHHQRRIIKKELPEIIKKNNIKLVIIDSIINHFRSEFGEASIIRRQQKLNKHVHDLLRLTELFNDLAIVITNQVASDPNGLYGKFIVPTGGNILGHMSNIRIWLRISKRNLRIAKIIDAPSLPEKEALFSITEDGIID